MKKKILGMGILLTIVTFALTGYVYKLNAQTDLIGKIRASSADNSLVIKQIKSDVDPKTGIETVTIDVLTEWNGLYLETNTSGQAITASGGAIDLSSLSDTQKSDFVKGSIQNAITKDTFIQNLAPLIDESGILDSTSDSGLTINDGTTPNPQARQYVVQSPKQTTPITLTAANLTEGSGAVTEMLNSKTKYDFVFVVEANHLKTVGSGDSDQRMRKALSDFTLALYTGGYDFNANIIEIGGEKAIYGHKNGAQANDTLYSGTGIELVTSSIPNATAPVTSLTLSNTLFPQEVFFKDSITETSLDSGSPRYKGRYFLQGYTEWLNLGASTLPRIEANFADTNLKKAIDKIGLYNREGSANKVTGGTNAAYGLFEAVNFLESKRDSTRTQVIVLISNQWMKSDAKTISEFLSSVPAPSTYKNEWNPTEKEKKQRETEDLNAKSAFKIWFTNKIKTNGLQLLTSISLNEFGGIENGDYNSANPNGTTSTKVDRLGNPVVDTYDSPTVALHPLEFKPILGSLMSEYEGSSVSGSTYTFQKHLKDILFNFIGKGRFYQTWTVKFQNTTPTYNKWKKILFSLGNFTLNYDSESGNLPVKTITILKKPISQASTEFAGTDTEIKAINPTENFYDRYYYTVEPPKLIFTNPSEDSANKYYKKWIPNSTTKKYSMDFRFEKFSGGALTSGFKISINSISVYPKLSALTETVINSATPIDTVTKTSTILNDLPYSYSESFDDTRITKIKDYLKNNPSTGNTLTFVVKWTVGTTTFISPIEAQVDFTAPLVSNFLIQNTTATDILKSFGIDEATSLKLTSADGTTDNDKLYIRNDKSNDVKLRDDTKLTFNITDDNLPKTAGNTIDCDSIKKSLEIGFKDIGYLGTPNVTVQVDQSTPNKVNVTVVGEMNKAKDNETITLPELEDAFGNKSTSDLKVDIIKLDAPKLSTLNLNSTHVTSDLVNNNATKSFRILTTVDTNGEKILNHKLLLGLSATTMADEKVIGFITPIQQDRTYRDADNGIYPTKFKDGDSVNTNLSYSFETAWSGSTIPANLNSFTYKTVLTLDNTKGDGIYDVPVTLPINRAGGIASATSGITFETGGNQNSINTLADLNKIKSISGNEYVIDTVAPVVTKIVKTGVVFKSNTKPYTTEFSYSTDDDVVIDSTISSNIKYSRSIFTGENIAGKVGDTYTVVLKDFSLSLTNISPGTKNNTINIATAKFYTFDIGTDGTFTAKDLAGNINNSPEKAIETTNVLPTAISYGTNAKNLKNYNSETDPRFARVNTGLFNIPTYAIATNLNKLATTNADSATSTLSGNSRFVSIATYSISKEGWVTELIKPIIWDTSVHDSNPGSTTYVLSNKVLLTKGNSASYSGIIDLSSIMEYSGLVSITDIVSSKGTFVSKDTVGTSLPNAGSFPIKSNFKVNISMTYAGSAPAKDTITFKAVDRLGNTRNFSVEATLVNNITIKGQSQGENKIIESKVNINSGSKKTEIKATKQGTKL